jgi:hypothetical protein
MPNELDIRIGNNKSLSTTSNKPRLKMKPGLSLRPVTKPWVPHTPDFLWSSLDSVNFMRPSLKKGAHAILSNGTVQEIRGISLVFREMWDTTNHEPRPATLDGKDKNQWLT